MNNNATQHNATQHSNTVYSTGVIQQLSEQQLSSLRGTAQAKYNAKARKPVAHSCISAELSLGQWLTELAIVAPKTTCFKAESQARTQNTGSKLLSVCPFTGYSHAIDCSAMPLGSSLPKQYLTVPHPMLSCYLPAHCEAELSLQWQVHRSLARLAASGLVSYETPLSLPQQLVTATQHRLTIAQDAMLVLTDYIASYPASLHTLPSYRVTQHTDIASVCVWAVSAASKAKTGSSASTGIDDIDSMLTANEREIAAKARAENAGIDAARKAAQRKQAKLNIRDSVAEVCRIMEDLPHSAWVSAIHSAKLELVCKNEPQLDIGWLELLADMLNDFYPDAHFVGHTSYASMLLVVQRLDLLAMQHAEAMSEMGFVSYDTPTGTSATIASAQERIASKYKLATTDCSATDSTKAATYVQPVRSIGIAADTAKALEAAILDSTASACVSSACVVHTELGSVASTNTVASTAQLSLKERLALAKAAAKQRSTEQRSTGV